MKFSKLFLIILLFTIYLFFDKVEAYDDVTSLDSNVSSACSKQYCWPIYKSSKAIRGMRVTLMRTDGTKMGETHNVIYDDTHYNFLKNYGNYYVLGSNCNKVQYLMGKCSATSSTNKTWDGSPYKSGKYSSASSLNNLFAHLGVSVSGSLSNWNIQAIWDWADGEKLPISDEKNVKLFSTMFGLSESEILDIAGDPELVSDLWILVEPLTMLRYNYKTYLGTNYELASLGYDKVLRTTMNSVIGRMMPCAAMTTGTIPKDAPGVSGTSYFNGNLVYVNPGSEVASSSGSYTISQVCTSDSSKKLKLKVGYPDGNKGVGVGVIYFRDLVKEGLSCNDVNEGIDDYDGFMKKLDETYKSSGLNGIFSLPEVSNGIKYNYNGEQKVADKEWYINECTCYGAYNTYKESSGKEIFTLPKTNIQTIFEQQSGLFTNYVEKVKQQIATIAETKPETVGTLTTWDFAKYERLKCEDAKLNCEEVDFGKLSAEPKDCSAACSNPWNWYGCNQCQSQNSNLSIINQCKTLPLFPDKKFTNDYLNENKSLYEQCFSVYNQQFGGFWNVNSYLSAGCNPDKADEELSKYNCTPKYNVGTCINAENVFYADSAQDLNEDDYWKYCVFSDENAVYDIDPHKWADKTKLLTYYEKNMGSEKYCEVYCIENFTGAFNATTITVKAGQHFIWDGHSASGNRTCKTKEIKWDDFIDDLKEANDKIELKYNQYLSEKEKDDTLTWVQNPNCLCYEKITDTGCGYNGRSPCYGYVICSKSKYNYTYKSSSYGSGNTYVPADMITSGSCVDKEAIPKFNPNLKYSDYNTVKDDAKNIYNEMLKCYNNDNSWNQWLYNVEPTAKLKYYYKINGSPGIYSIDKDMDVVVSYTGESQEDDCKNVSGGIEVVTSCSEKKCNKEKLNIKKCTKVEMEKGANIQFNIPSGIYEFINKDGNISFNLEQFNDLKSQYINEGKTFNYIYLGYSNFPVEYKTPDGLYGQAHGNGELSITYSNLGHKVGNNKTAVDEILSGVDSTKYGQWQCQFNVYSELIPDGNNPPGGGGGNNPSPKSGDIRLIYRPIDLKDPFPDVNFDGRNTGSNWCYGGSERVDCSNTNEVVTKAILENRNVDNHDLYFEEPMYTFVLTPRIISEIKKYNDINSYVDYYGNYGGKTFDFKCNEGTGRTCISGYLSELIDITNAKNLPGTCVDDMYRSYNDPNNFESCRY